MTNEQLESLLTGYRIKEKLLRIAAYEKEANV